MATADRRTLARLNQWYLGTRAAGYLRWFPALTIAIGLGWFLLGVWLTAH